ncbi:MAG: hypothetical protein QF489_01970 [Planctomycetota bacterium]|nr:hypothetical protein [Planctomycetota bacterium]
MPLLLALPQSGTGQIYDHNGDLLHTTPGTAAAGDVLSSIVATASSEYCGAARNGSTLLLTDSSDYSATIYLVDEATGASLGTVSTIDPSDFGLGYDSLRNLYITTNASSDIVSTFNSAGTLVSVWPAPGSGPVGASYDAGRDVYWITDWVSDTVSSVNPVTGATITTFSLGAFGCTRSAGTGFNLAHDQIIVGGRDQGMVFVMDASTGALVRSFIGQISSSNDPRGLASSSGGDIWQTGQMTNVVYELDLDNGPSGPVLSATGLVGGGLATIMVTNATAGGGVLIGYSLTGAGPTNTPFGTVSLSAPISQLPALTADSSGVTSLTTGVPPRGSGLTLYMHGVDLASGQLTNAIAELIL